MAIKNRVKTIFIGTPDFAIPSFIALMSDRTFKLEAAITQPDKPVGRSRLLTPPPIKLIAEKYDIPVFQPEKIREILPEIIKIKPDLIVVVAYAQIIPPEILTIPKFGCVNLHGSLLPKYRGAAVIQAPILSGDKETGVTLMKMDEKLDTGPIIYQKKIALDADETSASLFAKLSHTGAGIIAQALKQYTQGKLKPRPQDNAKASYVKTLKKEDGLIDWNRSAQDLERFIRAMNPWPGAITKIKEKGLSVKIIKAAQQIYELNDLPVGKVFHYKNRTAVQCGRDVLILERLQLEGKKEMTVDEFLRGHGDFLGSILA